MTRTPSNLDAPSKRTSTDRPRLWADVPLEDRLLCAELESGLARGIRCVAAVRPNGLGLPKGKYFRCLKPAGADGLCRSHQVMFARRRERG